MNDWSLSSAERNHLRALAHKQLEYSQLPIMQERRDLWYKHNDLQGSIPMIHFETWTCESHLLPPMLCESGTARNIELQLLRNMLNHERIGDDRVVPSTFDIGWWAGMVLFDLPIRTRHAEDGKGGTLGHQFLYPIKDLRDELPRLKPTIMRVDREGTLRWKSFLEELFGDILPVRLTMGCLGASLTQDVVHLMGMESMIFAMVDYPEEFHELMDRITRDHISYMKWLEEEKLLFPNNGNNGLAQGSFGFTNDLPSPEALSGAQLRTADLWGYMDSQETVSISPAMYGEFFYPYYKAVAENFGLLSYGCCEPVHSIWTDYVSRFPNLRKTSISPWCDEAFMGEALAGTRVIYHRKPSPNFVGVGKELDADAFGKHILNTIRCAKGCRLEFSFRDVYELGGNPEKPRQAVKITRELLDKYWN